MASGGTLVDICAIMSISSVSVFTRAVVPSIGVVADSVQVAFVRTSIAFINIFFTVFALKLCST